jgi:hypothetical protein
MVATAKNLIGNFGSCSDISHNNLFTFGNHNPADGSCVMSRAGTTPAERLYLKGLNSIGKLHESRGAREEFSAKVSKDSKGKNINSKSIDDSRKLFDL